MTKATSNPIKPYKVVDLLEVTKEIGGKDYHNHPVRKEWESFLESKEVRNDTGYLSWVAEDESLPLINEWMLANGFTKDEKVIFWICWLFSVR